MAFDIICDWLRCPLNAGKANFHLKRKMRKDMQNRFIQQNPISGKWCHCLIKILIRLF